jgi:DNA invertase Pin-like site-specific DNA recombinase
MERGGLTECLDALQEGDVLVVWKLDRLGRKMLALLQCVEDLEARGVGFRSIIDGFDTTTSMGRLQYQMLGAFAEYERNTIVERVTAGVVEYRKKNPNKPWGRPATDKTIIRKARRLLRSGKTCRYTADHLGISKTVVGKLRKEIFA